MLMNDIETFMKKIKAKRQYGCKRYINLSEDVKQRLVKYRKIILKREKERLTETLAIQ